MRTVRQRSPLHKTNRTNRAAQRFKLAVCDGSVRRVLAHNGFECDTHARRDGCVMVCVATKQLREGADMTNQRMNFV